MCSEAMRMASGNGAGVQSMKMMGSPWTKRGTTPQPAVHNPVSGPLNLRATQLWVFFQGWNVHTYMDCTSALCWHAKQALPGLERAVLAADPDTSSGTGHPSDASRTEPHSIPTAHRHPEHARAYRTGPSWGKHQATAQTANESSKHLLQKHPCCAQHKHLPTETLTRELQVHGTAPCSHTTRVLMPCHLPCLSLSEVSVCMQQIGAFVDTKSCCLPSVQACSSSSQDAVAAFAATVEAAMQHVHQAGKIAANSKATHRA
jgi:hypothetical protein